MAYEHSRDEETLRFREASTPISKSGNINEGFSTVLKENPYLLQGRNFDQTLK